jgi:hypothetical protein
LDGDTLKVCEPFPFEGNVANIGKRPKEFVTKPGLDVVLVIFKRMKP